MLETWGRECPDSEVCVGVCQFGCTYGTQWGVVFYVTGRVICWSFIISRFHSWFMYSHTHGSHGLLFILIKCRNCHAWTLNSKTRQNGVSVFLHFYPQMKLQHKVWRKFHAMYIPVTKFDKYSWSMTKYVTAFACTVGYQQFNTNCIELKCLHLRYYVYQRLQNIGDV